MFRFKMGRKASAAAAAAAAALIALGSTGTVLAAGGTTAAEAATEAESETAAAEEGIVTFSTDYPGVTVKPGDTATFSLYLTNTGSSETDVDLTAENLPDGWEGYFRGSSNEVSSVHVAALQTKDTSPDLSYTLTVPEDAEDGDYKITLKAVGGDVDSEATLTVKVSAEEQVSGAGEFTVKYAEQEGASGTDFSFDATLSNNSADTETYSLSASAPDGWTVSFTPSGASAAVASVPIEAGSSTSITIDVTPTDSVTAGDYDIDVTASCSTETLELPLKVTITGSYAATFTTPTGNLSASAYAGEPTKVTLDVTNTGNIDLENLQLSGEGSTDWTIEYDTDTIDSLAAGETKEVTATITPASNAIIGDYVTALTVSNDQISEEADIRVSVKNHTTWGIVAIIIIAALIAGLAAIIHKFGRR